MIFVFSDFVFSMKVTHITKIAYISTIQTQFSIISITNFIAALEINIFSHLFFLQFSLCTQFTYHIHNHGLQ